MIMTSIINNETGETVFTTHLALEREQAISALAELCGFSSVQIAERQMGGFDHLIVVQHPKRFPKNSITDYAAAAIVSMDKEQRDELRVLLDKLESQGE